MRPPVLLVTALTPAVWGTTYAVTTEFLPPDRPLLAGALRALPAGLLLVAVTRRLPRGDWWWRSAVLGALNIGVFFALLFVSAYRLPGGMAAVLGAGQPLIVAGLTVLLLAERVALRTVISAVIGAAGVALTVLSATVRLDPVGLLAGLAGTASMAVGLVLTKRWGTGSPLASTGWQLTAGGLLLVPVALLVEGPPPALTVGSIAGYAYLSLVGTAAAYTIWFWGLSRLRAAQVSLLALLSPLVATVVGWAVLGQALTPVQLLGMVVAFGAVLAGTTPSNRLAKVGVLDDARRESGTRRAQHRPSQPVGGRRVPGRVPDDQRRHGGDQVVDHAVQAGAGGRAVRGLDESGAEGVPPREGFDDLQLGPALDAGPHRPAVGVGAGSGDVHEGQAGVVLRQDACGR
ncbi:DMT family transporter [Actinoplanes sp. NPDC049681]|uniref:DMT family transporter n=1 Tax=Actinoplanes sp. NPDC049681 TaxID=3363905 RepID=UPI00378D3408